MGNDIKQAMEMLKEAGYCVEHLWNITYVQDYYKCDDSEAMEIAEQAISEEYNICNINDSIDVICRERKLEEIKE